MTAATIWLMPAMLRWARPAIQSDRAYCRARPSPARSADQTTPGRPITSGPPFHHMHHDNHPADRLERLRGQRCFANSTSAPTTGGFTFTSAARASAVRHDYRRGDFGQRRHRLQRRNLDFRSGRDGDQRQRGALGQRQRYSVSCRGYPIQYQRHERGQLDQLRDRLEHRLHLCRHGQSAVSGQDPQWRTPARRKCFASASRSRTDARQHRHRSAINGVPYIGGSSGTTSPRLLSRRY
jgi:hypothetical protein